MIYFNKFLIRITVMADGWLIAVISIVFIFCFILCAATFYFNYRKKGYIKKKIKGLANNALELTPEEFFELRKTSFGGKGSPYYALKYNFSGVYILYNTIKNMYYVGQGKEILNRVNSHFTGKGNGDVYADYKYGNLFTIKMIALEKSGFKTLNELERNTIATYDSFAAGYNKTRGNK